MNFLRNTFLLNASVASFFTVFAHQAVSDDHAPHVHGKAEVTIALESKSIEVNFLVPAESLLGFEHKATTDEDIAQVNAMKKWLSNPHQVIRLNEGDCRVNNVNVDTGNLLQNSHGSDVDAHDHSHAEVTINYQYRCHDSSQITSASVLLFNQFKGIKKVHALWITAVKQGAVLLDAANSKVNFQ